MKVSLFFVLILSTISLYANVGTVGQGHLGSGRIYFVNNKHINLKHEELFIDLYRTYAEVKVEYILKNTGDEHIVDVGFPCLTYQFLNDVNKWDKLIIEIENYKIYDNRESIVSKFIKGGLYKLNLPANFALMGGKPRVFLSAFVSKIKFKKNETKKIVIHYISKYQESNGGTEYDDSFNSQIFRYILSTGNTWKGPIKNGKITLNFQFEHNYDIKIYPLNKFKKEKSKFIWKFKNLEPNEKDNILINFNNGYRFTIFHPEGEKESFFIYEFNKRFLKKINLRKVKASSTLIEKNYNYNINNILDLEDSFWAEGVSGSGINESIELEVNHEKIDKIAFINGLIGSYSLYYKNNRIKDLALYINDKFYKNIKLEDNYNFSRPYNLQSYQWIDISDYQQKISKLKLKIISVYKGSKFTDTCFGKIRLFQKLKKLPKGKVGGMYPY